MTPAVIGGAAEAEVVRVGDDCKRHISGQRERVQRLQLALALLHDEIHAHDLGQHGGEMLQHALPAGQRRHVTGHDGVKYFPYVMTLFLFVLFANLLGLIPMSFTTTSHVAVTVTLALENAGSATR